MVQEKLHTNSNFDWNDGLFTHKQFQTNEFEPAYIDVRAKEGRIHDDDTVKNLPVVPRSHHLYKEWTIRKKSSDRLISYLENANGTKNILEIGCGNGWLCNRLSRITDTDVLGLDVNITELKQATRVFRGKKNLTFVAGDIFSISLPCQWDYIILASSIQYFDDLNKLLSTLLETMSSKGEIHILDSPIYPDERVAEAKARSGKYFESQGSPMARHYHHYSWSALSAFRYRLEYDPLNFQTRIKNKFRIDSPFPWIKIKRS